MLVPIGSREVLGRRLLRNQIIRIGSMPEIEVSLPDHLNEQIDRLIDQGDFLNREQAIEELLSMGISTYDVEEEDQTIEGENLFTQAVDDQQDPAIRDDDGGDDFTF